jgi:hypothetical protein
MSVFLSRQAKPTVVKTAIDRFSKPKRKPLD